MLEKAEIVKTVRGFLENRQEVMFGYIFGSLAQRAWFRDVDVAVYLADTRVLDDRVAHPYGYESTMIGELTLLLKTDNVDFVVLNKAGLTLSMQIINKGIRVLDRNLLKRVAIENAIRHEYIDAEPIRRIQMHYLSRKLQKNG
jgi:predicted nucleotidyltransferase